MRTLFVIDPLQAAHTQWSVPILSVHAGARCAASLYNSPTYRRHAIVLRRRRCCRYWPLCSRFM